MIKVQFLYFEGCDSHEEVLARLKSVMEAEGIGDTIEMIKIETDEQAAEWRFVGSPTILINGEDIVPVPNGSFFRLTCRTYRHEDGRYSSLPSVETIRRALRAVHVSQTP
ncbi:MAG: hypothetical protein OHK0023_14860 [Anaerolineae bacterium]